MKMSALFCFFLTLVSPAIRQSHALYVADFDNDQILVGFSHDVFVAKVIRIVGAAPIDNPMPHTRFEVEIVLAIKGTLGGKVFVDQSGGYKNGKFLINQGDVVREGKEEGLLEPGATYVFATRSSKENPENIFRLNSHPNGHSRITRDAKLNIVELRELAIKSPRVKELKEAYQKEIIPEVLKNDARNSYKDLKEIR